MFSRFYAVLRGELFQRIFLLQGWLMPPSPVMPHSQQTDLPRKSHRHHPTPWLSASVGLLLVSSGCLLSDSYDFDGFTYQPTAGRGGAPGQAGSGGASESAGNNGLLAGTAGTEEPGGAAGAQAGSGGEENLAGKASGGSDAGSNGDAGSGGGAGEAGQGGQASAGSTGASGTGGAEQAGSGGSSSSGGSGQAGTAGTSTTAGTGGTAGDGGSAGDGGTAGDGGMSPGGAGQGGTIGCVDPIALYPDKDGDGYGDSAEGKLGCDLELGWATSGGDCDDGNSEVFPGQPKYFLSPYTNIKGHPSYDYNCDDLETGPPGLEKAPSCSGKNKGNCTKGKPGYLPSKAQGLGLNTLCGSTEVLGCMLDATETCVDGPSEQAGIYTCH